LIQRDVNGSATVNALNASTVNAGTMSAATYVGTASSAFVGNLAGNVSATNINSTLLTSQVITGTSGIYGTILTASQPNITGIGTLTSLAVAGSTTLSGGAGVGAPLVPTANVSINFGSASYYWNNAYINKVNTLSADLAERFEADAEYEPGTVVELGGTAEITKVVKECSDKVFGVISTNPGHVMNSGAGTDLTHPPVAVSGRVPVRVIGLVTKGDRLVSAGNGLARAGSKEELTPWNVIGRSLVDKLEASEGIIEAIVKINS